MNFTIISTMAFILAIGVSCGKKKEGPREEAAPAPAAPAVPNADSAATPNLPQPDVAAPSPEVVSPQAELEPAEVGFEAPTTKTVTGRKLSSGMIFTGAGSDAILQILRHKESQLSADQQQQNADWADQIMSADWIQDETTKESVVRLRVLEGSQIFHYNLKSVLTDNQVSKAGVVSEAYGQATTGSKVLRSQMKCLDLNVEAAKCSTAVLVVKSSGRTAHVILRETSADLHYELFESSGNPEHVLVREFLKNSKNLRNTPDRVSSITYQSYEVLNGKSGFIVEILGRNKEYLGFSGHLLAEEAGSSVQATAGKNIWNARVMEARGYSKSSLSMMNTLASVRLVNNDGLGKIRLRVSQRPVGNFKLDQFNLTFIRRAPAQIELSESVFMFE